MTGTENRSNRGRNCCWIARREGWSSLPNWPRVMAHWDFGRPWRRFTRTPASNGVPCTRRPMSWTNCPNGCNRLPRMKLHDIWQADTREHAHEAFDLFVETYRAKYPKAVECLSKDRDVPGLLRLSGGTLGPSPNDQPHRIDVCHRASPPSAHERQRFTEGLPGDGLQVDSGGRKEMEAVKRIADHAGRHSRRSVHRRCA